MRPTRSYAAVLNSVIRDHRAALWAERPSCGHVGTARMVVPAVQEKLMRPRLIMMSLLVAAALAAAAVLAACSGADNGMDSGSKHGMPRRAGSPTTTSSHNAPDVMFARMMIPHHGGAIAMAELVPDRSTNSEVIALAQRIKAAQEPEIVEMTGWLASWGQPTSAPFGMHNGTGTTMWAGDLSSLVALRGTEFDREFLTQMIPHHQTAIAMATTEAQTGSFAPEIGLSNNIIGTQRNEIEQMQRILRTL